MKEDWETKKLGDICYFENGDRGKNYPSKKYYTSEGFPFITAANVENGNILENLNYINEERFNLLSRGKFKKNDFLFCLRGSLGKFGYVKQDLVGGIASSMVIVRTNVNLEDKWLYYYFTSDLCQKEIDSRKGGAAQPNLGAKDLKKFEIPIPSLEEQKQIVAILDKAFAAIDQAQVNIEKNIANANELFQSKLNDIFSQKGDSWEEKRFGDICQFVRGPFGGSLKKSYFAEQGYAVYEQKHAIYNQFENIRYFIDKEKFEEMKRFELNSGDLIMSCSGTMGKVAIVPSKIKKGIINQALLKLTPNESIDRKFLKYWMESSNFLNEIAKNSKGVAIKNVASVKILKEIKIPLTSINNQIKIVRLLEALQKEQKKIENHYQQKLANLEELKKSILQKAFTGELTDKSVTV